MSKRTLAIILATAGIVFQGADTADAKALAWALQRGDNGALRQFLRSFPDSPYVADVVISIVREVQENRAEVRSVLKDRLRPGYCG